jgi:hypothetical protein
MIIYLDEERAYVSWHTRHHDDGFVLDALRKPTQRNMVVHRASCPLMKTNPRRRSHWTTGQHLKACSASLEDLIMWARNATGSDPRVCPECRPDREAMASGPAKQKATQVRLTKLGRGIVSHVLDVAILYLDGMATEYDLTIQDLAHAFDRTVARVISSTRRLITHGLIEVDPPTTDQAPLMDKTLVYPTARALRDVPDFADMSQSELETELSKLHNP